MKSAHTHYRKTERGNALFYILIAVGLLAALTYAVNQSMSGGGGATLTQEQSEVKATEIIEYGNILAQATGQLRLRGCRIDQLNLDNDHVGGYTNPDAPGDNSCDLFHVAGGGVNWRDIPADWLDSNQTAQTEYGNFFFPNDTCVMGVGTNNSADCNGIDDEELLLVIPWVREEVCIAINKLLDITNPSGAPPTENAGAWDVSWPKFTGSLSGSEEIAEGGTAATSLAGKNAGCFEGNGANTPPADSFHFYRVLVRQ